MVLNPGAFHRYFTFLAENDDFSGTTVVGIAFIVPVAALNVYMIPYRNVVVLIRPLG